MTCELYIPLMLHECPPKDRQSSAHSLRWLGLPQCSLVPPVGSGPDEHLPISWQSPDVRLSSRYRKVRVYRSNVFSLSSSRISSRVAGAPSDSASALIRGANNPTACSIDAVRWDNYERRGSKKQEVDHTSGFSRIEQRSPAIDLSGGKALEDSLTVRRSDRMGSESSSFSSATALSSRLWLERWTSVTWSGMVEVFTTSEGTIRGSD